MRSTRGVRKVIGARDALTGQVLHLHAAAIRTLPPTSTAALEHVSQTLALARHSLLRPRIELVRACARMLTRAPQDVAIDGLAQLRPLFREVSDSMNANSHFCGAVISFIEALVLGYVLHADANDSANANA